MLFRFFHQSSLADVQKESLSSLSLLLVTSRSTPRKARRLVATSMDWMQRDSPHYDPNRIGAVSQAKVWAALTGAGKVVLTPCVHVRPYDFVIEDGRAFYRVQCKTGRLSRGAVYFR